MNLVELIWIVAGVGFTLPLLMPNIAALFCCSCISFFVGYFALIWYGASIEGRAEQDSFAEPFVFLAVGVFGAAHVAGVTLRLMAAWIAYGLRGLRARRSPDDESAAHAD